MQVQTQKPAGAAKDSAYRSMTPENKDRASSGKFASFATSKYSTAAMICVTTHLRKSAFSNAASKCSPISIICESRPSAESRGWCSRSQSSPSLQKRGPAFRILISQPFSTALSTEKVTSPATTASCSINATAISEVKWPPWTKRRSWSTLSAAPARIIARCRSSLTAGLGAALAALLAGFARAGALTTGFWLDRDAIITKSRWTTCSTATVPQPRNVAGRKVGSGKQKDRLSQPPYCKGVDELRKTGFCVEKPNLDRRPERI